MTHEKRHGAEKVCAGSIKLVGSKLTQNVRYYYASRVCNNVIM